MIRPTRATLFERRREMAILAHPILANGGWSPTAMNLGVAEFARIQAVNTTPDLRRVRLPRRFSPPSCTFWPVRSGRPPLLLVPSPPNPSPTAWSGEQETLLVLPRPLEPAEAFANVAPGRDVAPKGRVDAPKYRFCATRRNMRELCVSHSCVRGLIDFQPIGGDTIA